MNAAVGQIVISRAGRDAGRKFVVVRVIDDLYVEICDGDLRKVEKPKKKKIKHLNITDDMAEGLAEKLKSGDRITNAEIRKALVDFVS
ncbi:MAG: KOW domain-containing RNA-binding protein [Acetivibrionales bacterium]|nr:KOW domain-containing RNA-binding protein [Bacillota bacterium]NLP08123.1 RNA-binding protein [Clostridiaceae bacterium]HOA55359.1 KOW domain-containing RNA-binding protein [Clostridiales bacterium]HPZ04483.1 KOW domain-containing RNA-binding protein [Clostridiales bacterium]HQD31575.1 KOW domain-containing RNA-binding protein [Clostridiales bacterium]